MATASDVVTAALRRSGILDGTQTASSADALYCLEILNDMALSWEARNVYTGWATLALTDDITLEDKHIDGLKNMLAVRVCESFQRPVPADLSRRAFDGWQLICADYMAPENLRLDDSLTNMPSQRRYWNV